MAMVRFAAGFVTAAGLVFVWRRYGQPWTVWLFSRGDM